MKLHRRINRIVVASLSKRMPHTRLNVTLWAVFILAAILLPVWASSEARRLLAEYQASPTCASNDFNVAPQNCRMMVTIPVYDKWITYSGVGKNGLGKDAQTMQLKTALPNGEVRTLTLNFTKGGFPKSDSFEFDLFTSSRFLQLEAGKTVQAEYWQGKMTKVTVLLPDIFMQNFTEATFQTTDHPAYYPEVWPSKILSILGLLSIALILWTAYDLLRR